MSRAPEWTADEFKMVIQNSDLSSSALADLLPARTTEAIDIVRNAIHSYHQDRNISMLSRVMCRHLESGKGSIQCPRCEAKI